MTEYVALLKDFWKTKQYQILVVLSLILVSVICLWNIDLQVRVCRIDDEIGYWGIAAQLAGYDWADIMKYLRYYSFGYSLILVPVILLHHIGIGMAVCYKIAIFLNVIMLDASLLLALYVAKKWMPKINKYYRLLCVLTITLYANNILHSNTAWTEIFVYFLYWCILALIIKWMEKPDKKIGIAAVLLSVYIFLVHMRTLAVPVALFMILAYALLKGKIEWKMPKKKAITVLGIVAVLIVVAVIVIIKVIEVTSYQMKGTSVGTVNTLSNTFTAMLNFFSLNGLKDWGLSFLGKLYYQGIASFLLSYLGLGILIKKYIIGYKKKLETSETVTDVQFQSALFVVLCAVGSLLVAAAFTGDYFCRGIPKLIQVERIFHGRYPEFLIGILMLAALLHLGQLRKYLDVIMGSVLCVFITSVAVQYQWNLINFYHHDIDRGTRFDSVLVYSTVLEKGAYYASLMAVGVLSVICLFCIRKQKDAIKIGRMIVVFLLLIFFVIKGVNGVVDMPGNDKEKTVGSVAALLQSAPEAEIYCIGVPNVDTRILQWEMTERKIHVIEAEQLAQIDMENSVLISGMEYGVVGKVSQYAEFIYGSGTIAVYADRNTSVGAELCNKVLDARQMMYDAETEVVLAEAVGECGYLKADGYIYSNVLRKEGFVTNRTGLELVDGIYEFEVELEIDNITDERVGYVLATNEKQTAVNVTEILREDIGFGGKVTVTVNASIQNYYEPVVGVYTYGNSDIIVKNISCKQIASETPRNEAEMDEIYRILDIIDTEALRQKNIYYVDSDGSGVMGCPNIVVGDYAQFTEEELNIYQMPTWSVKYMENKTGNVFIVEKSGEYEQIISAMTGFYNRYETQNFILYAAQ